MTNMPSTIFCPGSYVSGGYKGDTFTAIKQALGAARPDDRQKLRAPCGLRHRRHDGVGLAVMLTTFRMSDDDRGGARIFQHFRADVP